MILLTRLVLLALMNQNCAIYPHMGVRQNIGFGSYRRKPDKVARSHRIEEVAQILGLSELLERRPVALSGGQRQRAAIGRAIIRDPVAFLFDESLSNLDAQLRQQMRIEIKKLHQKLGTTTIYITHDQIKAMTMTDRIAVMKYGMLLQLGTPSEILARPVDIFTARFIGSPSMSLVSTVSLSSNFIQALRRM